VGGDFFDVLRLENGKIGLAIADVSDKGVPAALFMMSSRTLLKGAAIGNSEPGEVLREVNDLLHENNETVMFVTLLYAVYDPATGEFSYANGGHNTPVIVHADGSSTLLPLTGGIALGVVPDLEYSRETVTLEPGDTAVLYTDGVTEAMNEEDEEFGTDRLCEIFVGMNPDDSKDLNMKVFEAVHAFAGDTPQSDDITCLTLHRIEA
jgi:sigma-B regulation protein RsbU (phosphoserine phosphatase)